MVALLITLIIYLAVLGIIYWIFTLILSSLFPNPIALKILQAVFALLALLLILGLFFGYEDMPRVTVR